MVVERSDHRCGDALVPYNYHFRPEVDNYVIFGVAVADVGMDVCVKFGDSVSNSIRRADFMSNEQDEAYPNSATSGISPNNNLKLHQLVENN